MPTISKLPLAEEVASDDLLPISQGGSVHAVSVGQLLASTQPAIVVGPPCLLGRVSLGPGGPDTIQVGGGLSLSSGTLSATGFAFADLPHRESLTSADQIVVTDGKTTHLIGSNRLRGIFTAGPNIAIDGNGVISTSIQGGALSVNLASLSTISTLALGDLVGVNTHGQNCAITYGNLLNGLTIDSAQPAGPAADGDTLWVGQLSNVMARQTLGALWPWISEKIASWRHPVVELIINIDLAATAHNNVILICTVPISISGLPANLGSGFSCRIINLSNDHVTLPHDILTSNGASFLLPRQSCTIYSLSTSAGAFIYAAMSSSESATAAVPGQPTGLVATSLAAKSVTMSWSPPDTGGTSLAYFVAFRLGGTSIWTQAGQTTGNTSFVIHGLQAGTNYEFAVTGSNNQGAGPASSPLALTTMSANLPPGAVTSVTAFNISQNGATFTWSAPTTGDATEQYQFQYKVAGLSAWLTTSGNIVGTTFSLATLSPSTDYDIQIIATNLAGAGAPSAPLTFRTAQIAGLVTSVSWNVLPVGTFVHGTGAMGVNVHVNPRTAEVKFGFSGSSDIQPTTWTTGVNVNSDLWGAYLPTPTTAGSSYMWVAGSDGSCPTVYATPITVA